MGPGAEGENIMSIHFGDSVDLAAIECVASITTITTLTRPLLREIIEWPAGYVGDVGTITGTLIDESNHFRTHYERIRLAGCETWAAINQRTSRRLREDMQVCIADIDLLCPWLAISAVPALVRLHRLLASAKRVMLNPYTY